MIYKRSRIVVVYDISLSEDLGDSVIDVIIGGDLILGF